MIPFILTTLSLVVLLIIISIIIIIMDRFASFEHWLVFAVSEAEKLFGGKTGKLKLRYVYDLAIKAFPVLTKTISFSRFSKYVDEALEIMRDMIKHNKNINAIISGKEDSK